MAPSLEIIWQELHQPLLGFIRRRVDDGSAAEDILQDVFLKVHMHIDTLQDASKLQSWIYQLARNAITDYYRRTRSTTVLPEQIRVVDDDDERRAERSLVPTVRAMLEQLPPMYREALIATEFAGLSQKELAQQLGISLSGAKSRVQRARQHLKQMLLDCCHFEFDQRNAIISYQSRCACCRNGERGPR